MKILIYCFVLIGGKSCWYNCKTIGLFCYLDSS